MILQVRPRFLDRRLVKLKRTLPGPGRILVKQGDVLHQDDVIGEAEISDGIRQIDFAQMFGVSPDKAQDLLTKKPGELVYKGEPLAKFSKMMGLRTQVYVAPIDGILESIDGGVASIKFIPVAEKILASFDGTISDVAEGESVTIQTVASLFKGVTGFGGQRFGRVKYIGKGSDILLPQDLTADSTDKIVIGGALSTADTIEKAVAIGVRGIVTGGINFHETMGWGMRELGITVVVLEGFGFHHIGRDLKDRLEKIDGNYAAISGDQAMLSVAVDGEGSDSQDPQYQELQSGDTVRVVAGESLGRLGVVHKISSSAEALLTGAKEVVVTFKSDEQDLVVPWQNLEIISSKK